MGQGKQLYVIGVTICTHAHAHTHPTHTHPPHPLADVHMLKKNTLNNKCSTYRDFFLLVLFRIYFNCCSCYSLVWLHYGHQIQHGAMVGTPMIVSVKQTDLGL